MSKPTFVYVIYIASTAEKVWHALTDAKTSERYWFGNHVDSDWTVGSAFKLKRGESTVTDTGVVLESDRPRRLSYTWHPDYEHVRHEKPSRVTFVLEQERDQVKLTITHDEFEAGSKVLESISGGWPLVLSSLKSFLETGRALRAFWYEDEVELQEAGAAASPIAKS